MNEHDHAAGENCSYRTGSTKPPRDYGGRIAAVLVALIFIGGIVSAFGMLNIKLPGNQKPQGENQGPVSFESGDQDSLDLPSAGEESASWPGVGLSGEFFSEAYRRYYDLPQGAHITQVEKGSPAEQAGILPGDILTEVNETPLENAAVLESALANCQEGDTLRLEIYRNHQTISVVLTVTQAQ